MQTCPTSGGSVAQSALLQIPGKMKLINNDGSIGSALKAMNGWCEVNIAHELTSAGGSAKASEF